MPDEKKASDGGLSLQTLVISACGAVAAATVVPLIWERGTLIATALTPVVVALVSEGLRKPVERVSTVAPRVIRRTGTGAAMRSPEPDAASGRDAADVSTRGPAPEHFEPLPPHLRADAPATRTDDPFGLRARRRPRRKIAVVTGLLAFVVAAAVVTASELAIFGGSISGERGRTTLVGGGKSKAEQRQEDKQEETPTATPTEEATPTTTPTETPTPEETPTPVPSATPTQAAPEATPTPVPTP